MKVQGLRLVLLFLLLIACVGGYILWKGEERSPVAEEALLNEVFIQDYLLREDGRIRTNLTDRQDVYLSETVGLWMEYLVMKNDKVQFEQQVTVLQQYFLTKDYLVTWELQGTKKAPSNAFIDDLRIINALYIAGEKWNHRPYTKLANRMSGQLVRFQTEGLLLVDHVGLEDKYKGLDVTLSYIIPSGFDWLKKVGQLSDEKYQATKTVLVSAESSQIGFYPIVYHVPTGEYSYDQEVNLIDQLYVGYHRAQWKGDVTPLLGFLKRSFAQGAGKLYGRYDSVTGKPTVSYEAPAVYALAILMCLEIEENDFAGELYNQMKSLQQSDENIPYYGGYIDIVSKDTHTFDNLLALIAERKRNDEKDF